MSTFESSPVHCLKWHPSGNLWRPGCSGAAVMPWSMSSNISFAWDIPCSSMKYSPTQVTKWSLKVPLINWWRISGVIISWMSARGKSFVKGYFDRWVRLTKISDLHTPLCHHQSHSYPTANHYQQSRIADQWNHVFNIHPHCQGPLEGLYI